MKHVIDMTREELENEVERLQSIASIANEYGIQGFVDIEELRKENERLTRQRDELVAAVKQATPYINGSTHGGGKALRILDRALIKAEEGK